MPKEIDVTGMQLSTSEWSSLCIHIHQRTRVRISGIKLSLFVDCPHDDVSYSDHKISCRILLHYAPAIKVDASVLLQESFMNEKLTSKFAIVGLVFCRESGNRAVCAKNMSWGELRSKHVVSDF